MLSHQEQSKVLKEDPGLAQHEATRLEAARLDEAARRRAAQKSTLDTGFATRLAQEETGSLSRREKLAALQLGLNKLDLKAELCKKAAAKRMDQQLTDSLTSAGCVVPRDPTARHDNKSAPVPVERSMKTPNGGVFFLPGGPI